MWLAIESVKNKEADIVVSAGNTGALLVISKLNLKMIENIDKPALSALWPNKKGMSVVLDLGANIECSSKNLSDFSIMIEKSDKFFELHSMFAPKSNTTLIPFLFGHKADRAGLSIFSIILRFSFEITNSAPVFPADTTISASLFFTLSIASHMLVFFPLLAPS